MKKTLPDDSVFNLLFSIYIKIVQPKKVMIYLPWSYLNIRLFDSFFSCCDFETLRNNHTVILCINA